MVLAVVAQGDVLIRIVNFKQILFLLDQLVKVVKNVCEDVIVLEELQELGLFQSIVVFLLETEDGEHLEEADVELGTAAVKQGALLIPIHGAVLVDAKWDRLELVKVGAGHQEKFD